MATRSGVVHDGYRISRVPCGGYRIRDNSALPCAIPASSAGGENDAGMGDRIVKGLKGESSRFGAEVPSHVSSSVPEGLRTIAGDLAPGIPLRIHPGGRRTGVEADASETPWVTQLRSRFQTLHYVLSVFPASPPSLRDVCLFGLGSGGFRHPAIIRVPPGHTDVGCWGARLATK